MAMGPRFKIPLGRNSELSPAYRRKGELCKLQQPREAGCAPESEVQVGMESTQVSLAGRAGVGLQMADQFRERFKARPGSGQGSEIGAY